MHHKWQSYDVWFLTGTHQTIFCYFGLCFALLPAPPMDPGNQNFEKKWKKHLEIFIILKMCTINDNHMMHGSQDIEHDRENFLSLWTIFCPLTPKTTQKILPKMTIMWCMVPEIWSMMSRTFCHFGPFFNLLPR